MTITSISRNVLIVLLMLSALPLAAATFVVPPDRDLAKRSDAIATGNVLQSYARVTPEGGIETVTMISVTEVIKGKLPATFQVVEPGGTLGGLSTIIPGVPRFTDGETVLLFLRQTGTAHWSVADLAIGKFAFGTERGRQIVKREAGEIVGWDPDMTPHREITRDAGRFLAFVRATAAGRDGAEDYIVPSVPHAETQAAKPAITPDIAPYSVNSYTMTISGSQGSRWNVFPNAVTFYSGTTTEPGAPGGGSTAISAAFAAWDNDCGSNVNYVYAGTDNGSHTQGLHAADGANTILFERDLSSWGVAPFSCSGNSYSGTLGLGGITSASGSNSVSGETFVTTQEGDVEMNRGIANCTLLFNNGDWNSAVTHETGHTLGFRHSDQTRNSGGACSSDPSLECASQAIMNSFVAHGVNATLQTWDQHAVQAVYPGNICAPGGPPTCTKPAITSPPQSTTLSGGQSTILSVGATGTAPLTYQWFTGPATEHPSSVPINGTNQASISVSPATTTSYWVRVSNACGSASSAVATVTVSGGCTKPSITAAPQSSTISAGQSTVLSVGASGTAPLAYQWFTGPATENPNSVPINGATQSSLTVAPTSTTTYWVRVTNSCGSASSATATVTVSGGCAKPSITSSPQSRTISAGQSTVLSVGASGTAPLAYQWFTGPAPENPNSVPINGANQSSLTVSPSSDTTYWVRVTNSCGSASSAAATVTVSGGCGAAPSITSAPQSRTISSGQSTTLSVGATGTAPLAYQWFRGPATENPNSVPISGATQSSVTVAPSSTTTYWVRVTNSCGHASSPTATVTVQ
jgi:Ig-like domain CHU_C associated